MIDPVSYNTAETVGARSQTWRRRAAHFPGVFRHGGFPTSIEGLQDIYPTYVQSLQDLYPLLDTMQDGRFDGYQKDIGGLTIEDVTFFTHLLARLVHMQRRHFPGNEPLLPFDALMSAYVAWRRVRTAAPHVKSVLEIGPGCGYLSLIATYDYLDLENYTQIEAYQSFYLLQAMVNADACGSQVWEAALAASPKPDDVIHHIPWWRFPVRKHYDVIIANACLCEFTNAAFDEYRKLFRSVSDESTLLFMQCPGASTFRTAGEMTAALHHDGWRNQQARNGVVGTYWMRRGDSNISILDCQENASPRTKEELIAKLQ